MRIIYSLLFVLMFLATGNRMIAQALTSATTQPCPGVPTYYTYTGPAVTFLTFESAPWGTITNLTTTGDGTSANMYITWDNVTTGTVIITYKPKDANPAYPNQTKTVNFNVKGLPVDASAYLVHPPTLACDYRGNVSFSCNVPGATMYTFNNNYGWPMSNPSAGNFIMFVEGSSSPEIQITASNGCSSISSSSRFNLYRSGPSVSYGGSINTPDLPTMGFCNNTVATFIAPVYSIANSYTWNADNSNILINGQHPPVTVNGVNNTTVTVEQDDKTQTNYMTFVTVRPNIDPTLGCADNTSTLSRLIHVGGYTVVAVPSVGTNGEHVSITLPLVRGATQYTWTMDGVELGTTTTPHFKFNYTSDCSFHTFVAYIDRPACGISPSVENNTILCRGIETYPAVKTGKTDIAGNIKTVAAVMTVFPNPANDKINVLVPVEYLNGLIRVYDVHGSVVKTVYGNASSISVDVGHLPSGLYIISLEKGVLEKQTVKIVKQ
ncbi:Por secretion system C-terminal sorting domain-containing protein [Chitinophaga costaii]|uniref:Por secretion system C-terminal sorting domain-containing protein n=1 Tax=Chitinophaga costaii TaxID=1335309 RepID=A0A1C4BN34_9BACT|nr:T9SS type A sorting domain-containing protein [Chitinophaga costaii]PUZ27541.1 T9SS C-terminal target domain-containing protein [Chitinophaga costaii]SCC08285.1 Por secretion system C-terminal sorting domain-containing protein [Chitinophaga costaii]